MLIRLVSLGCFGSPRSTPTGSPPSSRSAGSRLASHWPIWRWTRTRSSLGVAGMETQIAVAVLFGAIYYILAEDYARRAASHSGLADAGTARLRAASWLPRTSSWWSEKARAVGPGRGADRGGALAVDHFHDDLLRVSDSQHDRGKEPRLRGRTFPGITSHRRMVRLPRATTSRANQDGWTLFGPFFEAAFIEESRLSPTGSPRRSR